MDAKLLSVPVSREQRTTKNALLLGAKQTDLREHFRCIAQMYYIMLDFS
jgi:hypothetical protein